MLVVQAVASELVCVVINSIKANHLMPLCHGHTSPTSPVMYLMIYMCRDV